MLSTDKPPLIQTFHIPTKRIITIHSDDYSLNNAVFIAWSPDSQFLYIRIAPYNSKESNRYYLARPDNSFIIPLAENLTINPIWSPDNHMVSYYTFSPTETPSPRLYVMDVADYLADGVHPDPIISYATGVQWSPDGDAIAFIHYHPDRRNRAIGFYSLDGNMRFLTGEDENVISFTFLR